MSIDTANSIGTTGSVALDSYLSDVARTGKGARTTEAPEQLSNVLQHLSATRGNRQPSGFEATNDGVTNGSGAPALYVPVGRPDMATLILELQQINAKSQQEQTDVTKNNLEANIDKQDKLNQKVADNLKASQEQELEASKSSRLGKIFGWIGKVVAVVAAAVAVAVTGVAAVVSGGAAIPLLALSTMALVSATMSLANQVSQELGGPEISLSNLISSTSVKLLEAFGVDKEDAEKVGKVLVGAAAIAVPILTLIEPQMLGTAAEGISLLAGVSPEKAAIVGMAVGIAASITVGILVFAATSVASGGLNVLPSAVKLANGIIQTASTIVKGGTMIAAGAANIDSAVKVRDMALMQAQRLDFQTTGQALRQVMKDQQETLNALLQQIQDSMRGVATLISELTQSLSQISNNLGRTQSA